MEYSRIILLSKYTNMMFKESPFSNSFFTALWLMCMSLFSTSSGIAQSAADMPAQFQLLEQAKTSVVLLKNESVIPVRDLGRTRIASLTLGGRIQTPFKTQLAKYTAVQQFVLLNHADEATRTTLLTELAAFDLILVAIHPDGRLASGDPKYPLAITQLVESIAAEKQVILTLFDEAAVPWVP